MLKPDIYKKRVEEIMSKVNGSVEPLDPLSEALGKMKKHQIKELPVMERGKLKGLLTFRTLARRRKIPISAQVKSFMINPPKIKPTDRIHHVAERLLNRDFSSLPVTRKTDVLGMISRKDIINILREDEDLKSQSVESIMNFAPTTVSSGIGIKKALTLMDLSGETGAAMVDEKGNFLGAITTKDLVAFLEKPPHRAHTGDFSGEKIHRDRSIDSLTTMPATLSRSDNIRKAIDMLLDSGSATLYVLDGSELIGSINDVDLLEIFMKGPSRGGPLVQVAGIEDVKLTDASEFNSTINKYVKKIEKMTSISSITVRIRHHHHETDEDKYTVNVKVVTPGDLVVREYYDWNLLVAINNAFDSVNRHIKKEKEKIRKRERSI